MRPCCFTCPRRTYNVESSTIRAVQVIKFMNSNSNNAMKYNIGDHKTWSDRCCYVMVFLSLEQLASRDGIDGANRTAACRQNRSRGGGGGGGEETGSSHHRRAPTTTTTNSVDTTDRQGDAGGPQKRAYSSVHPMSFG